jgi:hypothetical protein
MDAIAASKLVDMGARDFAVAFTDPETPGMVILSLPEGWVKCPLERDGLAIRKAWRGSPDRLVPASMEATRRTTGWPW